MSRREINKRSKRCLPPPLQVVFYVSGLFGLAWCLAWFALVTDEPEDHPLISRRELKFILKNRSG